ncbi:hypothetical protein [Planctomycetes bacterium K23_9]|uniref:Flagellar MS-ring protein n=1 Tax=Stieleria marina TaxID=1930275 RepID=A0A517NN40_9BACT|nr:flagellar MS-ring protein [Planctomycetes bacterium K23_9]
MSVVRQFSDQFQSTFSAMPMSSRITTGLLAILVLVGFGFMVRSDHRSDSEMLFGGRSLSEQELDSVEMSFSHAGLNAWKREGRRISIPIESRSEYLAALSNAASLPVSIRSSVQDAIEKTTIFESSSQRLAREMHAKEQDLGNKLTAFPEIRWASVDYDIGEREGLGRDRQQTASVMVLPEAGRPLTAQRIVDIKKFIGSSYAGMNEDDVVVIDTHASSFDEAAPSSSPQPVVAKTPAEQHRLDQQSQIEKQVRELLGDYGPIRVSAYVEMSSHHADQQQMPPPEINASPSHSDVDRRERLNAITRVRSNRATSLRQNVTPGSQAGPPAQRQDTIENSVLTTESLLARVNVSIGLPQSYYSRLWDQLYGSQVAQRSEVVTPPATAAQLEQLRHQTQANIRAAIAPWLVSMVPQQPRDSMVDVYDFPDLLNPTDKTDDLVATATSWLSGHWQQVALLLLGFAGLMIALKALGNAPAIESVNRPLSGQVNPGSSATGDGPYPTLVPQTPINSPVKPMGTSDRELLALIEQDPDAAVDVIRDWIGEAA